MEIKDWNMRKITKIVNKRKKENINGRNKGVTSLLSEGLL